MRLTALGLPFLFVCAGLAAQTPAVEPSVAARAAATITEADVRRRIDVIADDSMLGRDTPSRGLDLTARYVAGEFRRLGLRPGGDGGTYLQRYPILRTSILGDRSSLTLEAPNGERAELSLASAAAVLSGTPPAAASGGVVLLGGAPEPSQIREEDVRGRFVLWPLDFEKGAPRTLEQVALAALRDGALAVIAVTPRDPQAFAAVVAHGLQPRARVDAPTTGGLNLLALEASERAIAAAAPAAARSLAELRASASGFVRLDPQWHATLAVRDTVVERTSAPNAVGILRGSDPQLRDEYVVFSGHMDHLGVSPGAADSIYNGADDDASGSMGVVELAEAYATRGLAPRRSLIFVTVSGEEKGMWGSSWFVAHPPVPLERIVADLNMDMIGRNWKDTVAAIGREHSDLGATLERVAAGHPELRMTPVGDRWPTENRFFRSDHYSFARRGVPILFFSSGYHADYHEPSDSPDKIDAEKEARTLQLIFYVGQAIADAPARPRWNSDSYRRIVQTGAP